MSSLLRNSFLEKQAGPKDAISLGQKLLGWAGHTFGKAPANAMRATARSMKGFTGTYAPNGSIVPGSVKGTSFADKMYNVGQSWLDKPKAILKATGKDSYNPWIANTARIGTGALLGGGSLYGVGSWINNSIEKSVANHAYDASVQTANQLLAALANRPWYERLYNVFNPTGFSQEALGQAIPMITDTFIKQMESRGHKGWKPESLLKL